MRRQAKRNSDEVATGARRGGSARARAALATLSCLAGLMTVAAGGAGAAPGDLDPGFSSDGLLSTNLGPGPSEANAVVRQPDGKLIAVGSSPGRDGFDAFFLGPFRAKGDFAVARYNADGTLDQTFSMDGRQNTDFGSADEATAVALQPDGKIVVVGAGGAGGGFAVVRYATDGSLDGSFSGDGRQVNDFEGSATGVAVQQDGRIVAVGQETDRSGSGVTSTFALTRYMADGTPDASFSGDGKQTAAVGTGSSAANAVALQPDGRIVAVGSARAADNQSAFAVARFTTGGDLDPSFSGDGRQTTVFPGAAARAEGARAVALQLDGRIVSAGGIFGSDGAFALIRYLPDGTLDSSFSGDGTVTTPLTPPLGPFDPGFIADEIRGVAVAPDGRIVAAGEVANGTQLAITRYAPDGSLDPSFSGDGKLIDAVRTRRGAGGVALAPDARITVAAGALPVPGVEDLTVLQYLADGSRDPSFSGDGLQGAPFPGQDGASAVAVQPDGKVIAAGAHQPGLGLTRYSPDGSLDPSFSGDGIVIRRELGAAEGVAVQPNGAIVAAGGGSLARFTPEGSLDPSFATNAGRRNMFINALALQSDGRIIVVGGTNGNGRPDDPERNSFVVARFNSDGSPDTTFSEDGRVTTLVPPTNPDPDFGSTSAEAVALYPDGRIVVAGGRTIVRYTQSGSPDPSFSDDGKLETTRNLSALAVQADGKMVAGGSNGADFAVLRFDADGAPDAGFAVGGQQLVDFSGRTDGLSALVIQADGAIVAAGGSSQPDGTDNRFAVARLNPNGSLNTSFSEDGRQTTSFTRSGDVEASPSSANDVALAPDGSIVAVGGVTTDSRDFAIVRYQGGGALGSETAEPTPDPTPTPVPEPPKPEPDTTPPTIAITKPASGERFALGSTAPSAFSCTDGTGSGVATCDGPPAIDTSTPGTKTFAVTATDKAGNTTTTSVGYVVDPKPADRLVAIADLERLGTKKLGRPASVDPRFPLGGEAVVITPKNSRGAKVTIPRTVPSSYRFGAVGCRTKTCTVTVAARELARSTRARRAAGLYRRTFKLTAGQVLRLSVPFTKAQRTALRRGDAVILRLRISTVTQAGKSFSPSRVLVLRKQR